MVSYFAETCFQDLPKHLFFIEINLLKEVVIIRVENENLSFDTIFFIFNYTVYPLIFIIIANKNKSKYSILKKT